MKRIQLLLVVLSLVLSACMIETSATSAAIPTPGFTTVGDAVSAVPLSNGALLGTPPQVLLSIEQGKALGAYPAYHGTNAYALLSAQFLRAAGYPEEQVLAVSGQFMSWDAMEQYGVCFICLTRNALVSNAPGFTERQVQYADHLWIGLEGLDDEIPGTGYSTASNYATRVITTRLYDISKSEEAMQAAQLRIAALEPLAAAGQATVGELDELALARQRVAFELNRQTFVTSVRASSQAALFEEAMNTPIVLEFSPVAKSEVTRTSFLAVNGNGVGTRFISPTVPFSRIVRIYMPAEKVASLGTALEEAVPGVQIVALVDDAAAADISVAGATNLLVERVPGGFAQGYNLWNSMPANMYRLAFGAAATFEAIMYYMPMISFYVFIATPEVIYAVDRWQLISDFTTIQMQGRTNMTVQEYEELFNAYASDIANFGYDPSMGMMGGIYQPAFDMLGVDPETPYRPWSWTSSMTVGETAELPMVAPAGYLLDCDIPNIGMGDCIVTADDIYPSWNITLLSWSNGNPIIHAETLDGNKNPISGDAEITVDSWGGNAIVKAGCQSWPEYNNAMLNRTFVIRWVSSADRSTVKFFSRPYFWVASDGTCVTE